jgi:hypothetical protein
MQARIAGLAGLASSSWLGVFCKVWESQLHQGAVHQGAVQTKHDSSGQMLASQT